MSNHTRCLIPLVLVGCVSAGLAQFASAQVAKSRVRGTAITALRQALPGHRVHLRSLNTGRLVQTVTTAVNGEYTFDGMDAGTYWIEVQDPAGRIISTDGPFVIGAAQSSSSRTTAARRTFAADSVGSVRAIQLLANSKPGPAAAVMEAAADAGIRTRSVDSSTRPLPSGPR